MAKKNMFDEYIIDKQSETDSTQENPSGEDDSTSTHIEPSEESIVNKQSESSTLEPDQLNFPASFLPWSGSNKSKELTTKLINGGYTTIKMIATATRDEIISLTDLPVEYADRLISNAKEWFEFNFETAANLLSTRESFRKISTGSSQLDQLLGGGIEPKSITEFYGEFTTGKTQLCMQLALNTVLPPELGGLGAEVVYIDTEGSFRPERIVQMVDGLDISAEVVLNKILVGRSHNTNIQMQLTNNILQIAQNRNIKLVIVDSLTSNFRSEFVGKGALMDRQQKLNQHVQQLSRLSDLLDAAVVVTNQVLSVIDGFENTVVPVGGNILAHGTTHRIHLTKSKKNVAVRYAKLVASPSLPEKQASFKIMQNGITDSVKLPGS